MVILPLTVKEDPQEMSLHFQGYCVSERVTAMQVMVAHQASMSCHPLRPFSLQVTKVTKMWKAVIEFLGWELKDLVQAFEKRSTEAQDHVGCCKYDEAGTMVTVENVQPPSTKAKKTSCWSRWRVASISLPSLSSPNPGLGESTGSKAHTIKAILSNIIIRK